ncbi:hypothetical protein RJT34_14599 [Clitoria ternatea]|uniref:Pectinesterase inhibitor domain-containing protein n=1 Tax=Clitoria ternatea TaxID=43366 RepID=A0AAN9JSS7_CLITE
MNNIKNKLMILLCLAALGKCTTAHDSPTAQPPKTSISPKASEFLDSKPPNSEAPNNNDDNDDDDDEKPGSGVLTDIFKGTLRGHAITMPGFINPQQPSQVDDRVRQICSHTDYPDICVSTVPPFISHKDHFDVMKVLEASIMACSTQTKFALNMVEKHVGSSARIEAVLADCKEEYNAALVNLGRAMDAIPTRDLGTVTVMLSAVMADVSTCENGFEELKLGSPLANHEGIVTITASNCLSIASLIPH